MPLLRAPAPTLGLLHANAKYLGQVCFPLAQIVATMKDNANKMLRMPKAAASMVMEIAYPMVPFCALVAAFPSAEIFPEKDGVQVALIRSMTGLWTDLELDDAAAHGKGCTRLVIADQEMCGRSLLSFTPVARLRTVTSKSGVVVTTLTCPFCILDESGELRTPKDKTYTDAETTEIIEFLCQYSLTPMYQEDWAISPLFLRLIGETDKADEVQAALEAALHQRGVMKSRRQERLALLPPAALPPG